MMTRTAGGASRRETTARGRQVTLNTETALSPAVGCGLGDLQGHRTPEACRLHERPHLSGAAAAPLTDNSPATDYHSVRNPPSPVSRTITDRRRPRSSASPWPPPSLLLPLLCIDAFAAQTTAEAALSSTSLHAQERIIRTTAKSARQKRTGCSPTALRRASRSMSLGAARYRWAPRPSPRGPSPPLPPCPAF